MYALFMLASLSTTIAAPVQGHDTLSGVGMAGIGFLKGDWQGKQSFNTGGGGTMVADIADHVSDAVGGRYLEEKLATMLSGQKPTDVRHFLTYDPKTKMYRAWWFNDTSVGPMEFEGTLTGSKLVMQTREGTGPRVFRATYDASREGKLHYTFELQAPTGWQELFSADYTKG